ncbi:ABC transporter permease [Mycolicibacterium alvei]|uniref:ABC transporter n=1 Tax=Mycolicibacterium alvei TaxID=67081 RepID=A0A6N4V1C0_9MYCO|nr:ABC transporter permease [Mycolicibacterium alvei]MCV7003015.1 ABC transporter permease [Mycolicibacterium alvei]BBX29664.1 ABC transporter [Mycolicibacterium alvei]
MTAHVLRSMRAEMTRTGGRGPLWSVLVPAAVILPAVITFLIAYVAERFARIPGQSHVQQVSTTNAAYWVITVTVVLSALAAAHGQAHEFRSGANQYVRFAVPRTGATTVGKWLFYGTLGAALSAATVVLVLVALPQISESVYGQVSLTDPHGLRLLWTVPLYAFFAAGLGLGVGALIRTPAAAVGAILLWVYVIETAVGYLPGGYSIQRFMPFLNGVYATGQDIVLTPPWGPNVALAYTCALFSVVPLCSTWCTALRGGIPK